MWLDGLRCIVIEHIYKQHKVGRAVVFIYFVWVRLSLGCGMKIVPGKSLVRYVV
jgi:hypothetical protein